MKPATGLLLILLLAGCAQLPPAIDYRRYDDPMAGIHDSYQLIDRGTQFFFVKSINGISPAATLVLSGDEGLDTPVLGTYGQRHTVDATGPARVVIALSAMHMTDDLAVVATDNTYLEGEVRFQPQAGMFYQVRGHSDDAYHAIWLEDSSGRMVSGIVERLPDNTADPAALRERYLPATTEHSPDRAEIFMRIAGGETPQLVQQKLGPPSSLKRVNRKGFNTGRMTYHYDELGSIHFWEYYSWRSAYSRRVDPDFAHIPLALLLTSTDPRTLHRLARWYSRQDNNTPADMDRIAQWLWQHRHAEQGLLLDAAALFSRTLAHEPRYRQLLGDILQDNPADKLQRHVTAGLEKMPAQQVAQFVPQ